MPLTPFTDQFIKSTYTDCVQVGNNGAGLTSAPIQLCDGLGNPTALWLSKQSVSQVAVIVKSLQASGGDWTINANNINMMEWQDSAGNAYVYVGPPALQAASYLGPGANFFAVNGTYPAILGHHVIGAHFNFQSVHITQNNQHTLVGLQVDMLAGFDAPNQGTTGLVVNNLASSTGSTIFPPISANCGIETTINGAQGTTGTNIGMLALSTNAALNIGHYGYAVSNTTSNQVGIGVLGVCHITAATPPGTPGNIGGYFGFIAAPPATWPSAALICNNGGYTLPAFLAQVNGVTFLQVDPYGSLVVGNGTSASAGGSSGFLYLPTGFGPTGTPTSYPNAAPLFIDGGGTHLWTYIGGNWVQIGGAAGGVTSVASPAGNTTLNIAPNTGNVLISLNLGSDNEWTNVQTFDQGITVGSAAINGSVAFAGTASSAYIKLTGPATLSCYGSPSPAAFLVYNTFDIVTGANNEFGGLNWIINPNILTIGTNQTGTGVARPVNFQVGGTSMWQLNTLGQLTMLPGVTMSGGSSNSNWVNITGTLPAVATAGNVWAFQIAATGAGNDAHIRGAAIISLTAGYTGASTTYGALIQNTSVGTGASIINRIGNIGVQGQAAPATTGYNFGVLGVAAGAPISIGCYGQALSAANTNAFIGVLGLVNNTTVPVGGYMIGGYFGIFKTPPFLVNAALVCDTGDAGSTITAFLVRVGGLSVFQINGNGENVFSRQAYFSQTTLTQAAPITWDVRLNQRTSITFSGGSQAFTLSNPTNAQAGATYTLEVNQGVGGNNTLSYGTAYKWPGGTPPVLTTAANAVDVLEFYYDGVNMNGRSYLNFH
jgi:hypothetical protein